MFHRISIICMMLGLLLATPTVAQTTLEPGDPVLRQLQSDPVAARATLEARVLEGDAEAMNMLAILLSHDTRDWPGEPERSLALLEQAAAAGEPAARINLATRLLLADDASQYGRAIDLLRQVEGDARVEPLTRFAWGYAYLFGRGVERDLARGSQSMQRAVEAHPTNMIAQFLLARSYQNGWGIEPDPVLAYRHMRIAADAGDERAQWQVGMMLLNGSGVQVNEQEAYRFVRASGEAGYLRGMISTAVMLALGQGVEENDVEARDWYRRAAEQGSAHALRGLGGMLLSGEGGPADPERGVAYLLLAFEAGDALAGQTLDFVDIPDDPALQARLAAHRSQWVAQFGRPTTDED